MTRGVSPKESESQVDTLECTPAYGRDYTSAKAVKTAWNDNLDFQIATFGPDMGRFINKQDAVRAGLSVMLRYARLTKVVYIK